MKISSITRICACLCLISSIATASILIRSGSRSRLKHILLHPGSWSTSQGTGLFQQPIQSFNRPIGTIALHSTENSRSFENTYGRTFGQYGSYRNHQSWQDAVKEDNQRHSIIENNLKETFPWLFKNMKTPSLRGFGLDGFWNSYTPYIPDGTQTDKDS